MSDDPDFLLQKLACEGSGKEWTESQVKRIEQSGFFETAKKIRVFGSTYYMSPSNYNALIGFLFVLALMITSIVTLAFAYFGRVR